MANQKISLIVFVGIILPIGIVVAYFGVFNNDSQYPDPLANTSESKARKIARDFVESSPTYSFDGVIGSLIIDSLKTTKSFPPQYSIQLSFQSSHAGYGDREGQNLPKNATLHRVDVIVTNDSVYSAIIDRQWDEIKQTTLGPISISQPTTKSDVLPTSTTVNDLVSFVDGLREKGIRVTPIERLEQSIFSVKSTIILVGNEEVRVYEFDNIESLEKESTKVSSDGTQVGNNPLKWSGPPHFYKQGKIIVLYVGSNGGVLSMLDETMGKQFAGQ